MDKIKNLDEKEKEIKEIIGTIKEIKNKILDLVSHCSEKSTKLKNEGWNIIKLSDNLINNLENHLNKNGISLQEIEDLYTTLDKEVPENLSNKIKKIINNLLMELDKNQEIVNNLFTDTFELINKSNDFSKKFDTNNNLTEDAFNEMIIYLLNCMNDENSKVIINFISLGIFDMNKLKELNAKYGQAYAQEIINKLGENIRNYFDGLNIRYGLSNYKGGDEWYIYLINKTPQETQKIFNDYMKYLENSEEIISPTGEKFKLSTCLGIVNLGKKDLKAKQTDYKKLIYLADVYLAYAKLKKVKNPYSIKFKDITDIKDIDEVKHPNKKYLQYKENILDKHSLETLNYLFNAQTNKLELVRAGAGSDVLRKNVKLLKRVILKKMTQKIVNE